MASDNDDKVLLNIFTQLAQLGTNYAASGAREKRVEIVARLVEKFCEPVMSSLGPTDDEESTRRVCSIIDDRVDLAVYTLAKIEHAIDDLTARRAEEAIVPPPPPPGCTKCGTASAALVDGLCGTCVAGGG